MVSLTTTSPCSTVLLKKPLCLNVFHLQLFAALSEGPVHSPAAALQLDSLSLLGLELCFNLEDLSAGLCLADPLGLLLLPLQPLLFQTCLHTLMGQQDKREGKRRRPTDHWDSW